MEGAITSRTPERFGHRALAGAIAIGASLALHATAVSAQRAATPAPATTEPADTDTDTDADSADEPATPAVATGPEPATPAWRWRQVLSAPRILNRFTSVTVDPIDADHVVVGTEEGTIIRSVDGGRTWEERELFPGAVARRSIGLPEPTLEGINHRAGAGGSTPSSLSGAPGPTNGQAGSSNNGTPGSTGTINGLNGRPSPFVTSRNILTAFLNPRDVEVAPVRRIAMCPRGRYPLVVATTREVFGSIDDGNTFVRLYAAPPTGTRGSEVEPPITMVACSPTNPNDIVIAVSSLLGVLRSTDGGVLFLNNITGSPAGGTNAITFDDAGAALDSSQPPVLLFAADAALYVGDPDSQEGVQFAYPDYDDPSLAPTEGITWITTTSTGQIWLGTENGVRYSPDGGGSWRAADRALFDRLPTIAIAEGIGDTGRSRVAVALERGVYSTEDGGRSFQPFFLGITRRNITHITVGPPQRNVPARWWITAGGELWATVPEGELEDLDEDSADARWARDQIRTTLPLDATIQEAWEATRTDPASLQRMTAAARSRAAIPLVGVVVQSWDPLYLRNITETGAFNTLQLRRYEENFNSISAFARWTLPWGAVFPLTTNQGLPSFLALRQDIQFIVEDAWHERMLLLQRIAHGERNQLEVAVMRERIGALEALLRTWSSRR